MALPEKGQGRLEGERRLAPPSITMPKSGGAIRGIGEKFAANPVTGTGSMSVPLATSPGRSGSGPQLSLTYDSGAGNGPFGFGWSLSLPAITRKTDKGLPRYQDSIESDVFILSGAEELVHVLVQDPQSGWTREQLPERVVNGISYRIDRYRPRIEGLFARIERWTNAADVTDVFWRSISKDNITTWYGKTSDSRIADPDDPSRIFSWLICQSHDDKGNVIVYGYKSEDSARIFEDTSVDQHFKSHERNRTDRSRSAQRYLKYVRYGNHSPYLPVVKDDEPWPEPPDAAATDGSNSWCFEVVFDYGEHDISLPTPNEAEKWPARKDPFSSYRAGFEVRTYRNCQRVLMFHHFPGEVGVERGCLVRSTDFTYSHELEPTSTRNPVYTFLKAVTQNGYRRHSGGYEKRSLPPLEFEYTEPVVQNAVLEVDLQSLENLPIGLDGSIFRWTDLHGEGIPGILTEQAGEWFYKRNLSPLADHLPDGSELVKARFAPLETVALKPNVSVNAGAEFMDLAGDGQPDVVVVEGPTPGLYEHDDGEGWKNFSPFKSRLNRDFRDPNLKFIDLNGDGHADVLISEDDAFLWHPSLAEDGFAPALRVSKSFDEEQGPRIVFADGSHSIYLADMSGDGLTDIVRITFSVGRQEVCYWPNLGYGRFGTKVTMDNSPGFDHPELFDHKRIRLADIDGSGTTDIIYLHRDGVRLYFNQSGNGWSEPHHLKVFPPIDNLAGVIPVDLLGNGTACLVWSSSLPGDTRRPMRYVKLMGDNKPHLLVSSINNLGAETQVTYAPSTKFYLQDKRDGKPWITRLPFPVQVVEKVTTCDYISRNRFVTRFAYHHGYFDGEEREFRGFGLVEQWDTEEFAVLAAGMIPADNIAPESHVPSVHTKSWYHTGVYDEVEETSQIFAAEYYGAPQKSDANYDTEFDAYFKTLLPDTVIPPDLTPAEEREACRALKGVMLRQEVYSDDVGPDATDGELQRARTPYTVIEQNFTIRTLQPRGANRHAVFYMHDRESISYHHERNLTDPRVGQALTLDVDDYGNILTSAAVGYGRGGRDPALALSDQDNQVQILITFTESSVTNAVQSADDYRSPLPCQSRTYQLTHVIEQQSDYPKALDAYFRPKGRAHFTWDEIRVAGATAIPLNYEKEPTPGQCEKRLIENVRTYYRHNDLTGSLPLATLQSLALPFDSYKLAFTPGLISQIFQRPRPGQPNEPLVNNLQAVLGGIAGDQGGYADLDSDGCWWIPSGRQFYHPADVAAPVELAEARSHFYMTRRYRDPFGNDTIVDFDAGDLLLKETRDALGNRVTVEANDYRVLHPRLLSDPNRNQTEVAFDTLGMVVGTAVMGKPLTAPMEGDSLSEFITDLTQAQIDGFFDAADPHANAKLLLKEASTRIVYDLDRFQRTQQAHPGQPEKWLPACSATLARETHVHAPLPPQGLKIQVSFSYSDGFGREIQKKNQAEPGAVPQRDATGRIIVGIDGLPVMTAASASPRWVGSGWTVFNNKGNPVREFEPFFTDTHRYEFDVRIGVSPVLFYDPLERVIATLYPNHTYEKVKFDPWQQTSWDVNDTCVRPIQSPEDPPPRETGDPRTDPDISGYVADYFRTQPTTWQTWHSRRSEGALGIEEARAAERAAAHADTPKTEHFDALGRPFLTVARNRVICTNHPLHGKPDERFCTRVELDIEGNQLRVFDERKLPDAAGLPLGAVEQRTVLQAAFDMLGNRIYQFSMEAGARWMLNDVAGNPIRTWDSRGHNFTTRYDTLRRSIAQTVRGTFSNPDPVQPNSDPRTLNRDILVDKIEYGEPPLNATAAQETEAQRLNMRTRIYRHFDSAGVATNARLDASGKPMEAYDFKGNLLHSTRRMVSDYKAIPNWMLQPQLDTETFEGSTRYDALNRTVQSIAPHSTLPQAKRSIIQPVFNEANLLERVDVWLERIANPTALLDPAGDIPSPVGVAGIDYDAKGQRTLIDYKTEDSKVIRTTYAYDRETFRLRHLYTRRGVDPNTSQGVAFTDDCENPSPPPATTAAPQKPPAGSPCGLQNLHYTYDPAGNITHVRDDSQQTIYFKNKRIEASNDYVYDALYRLIQADGREHLGQLASGEQLPPTAPGGFNVFHARLDHPGNGNALGTYTERYIYDAVGNFLLLHHRGNDPQHAGWTRKYIYEEGSLIESGKKSNRLSRTTLNPADNTQQPETYPHDAHGNMLGLPHLTRMDWDYRDRLLATSRQVVNDAPPPANLQQTTYYVYDSSGQRVRKVCEKGAGLTEDRIYYGGQEIFRKYSGAIGPNTATLERLTLHVMDDRQRIALVELRTLGHEPGVPQKLIRYQCSNHLGSSSLEVDEQAQIVSYEEYTPFGSSTYLAVRSQTDTAKRYRYTGKERDEESGMYYHDARYLAPWLGRWTSCDPLQHTNLYAFVENNPIRIVDPDGMAGKDLVGDALGKVQGAYQTANKVKFKQFAEDFEVTKHWKQGASRYIDPITRSNRLTESEHLIPRAGIVKFNPSFNYEGATTIILPREVAKVKTVFDNRLSAAVKKGMKAEEFISRAKGNAVRSVADHWAQTGNTTLREVKKVASVAETAEKESGVLTATARTARGSRSLSALRCLPVRGLLKIAKPLAIGATVLTVGEKVAHASQSGSATDDKLTRMDNTAGKVEDAVDATLAVASMVPGTGGKIVAGATANAEIAKMIMPHVGSDKRIVDAGQAAENFARQRGAANPEAFGATAAGTSGVVEGSGVIAQVLSGPVGWAGLGIRYAMNRNK